MPDENNYLNLGISAQHLNAPNESFSGQQDIIPVRYNGFLNGNFKVQNLWIINPNIYYSNMASTSELVFGLNVSRKLDDEGYKQLMLGCYLRKDDAFIPMAGFQLGNSKLTFSYDATNSAISTYKNGLNAYEVSLIYRGNYSSEHEIKCPRFVRF